MWLLVAGILSAVGVLDLSGSVDGLLLGWYLGSVCPGFSELSLDIILVHSPVDWITQRKTLDYTTF